MPKRPSPVPGDPRGTPIEVAYGSLPSQSGASGMSRLTPVPPPPGRRGPIRRVKDWWSAKSPRTRFVAPLAALTVVAGAAAYPGTTLLVPARNSGPLEFGGGGAGICMSTVPVGRVITVGEAVMRNRSPKGLEILHAEFAEASGMEITGVFVVPMTKVGDGGRLVGTAPTFPPPEDQGHPMIQWDRAHGLPVTLPPGEDIEQVAFAVRITQPHAWAKSVVITYRSGWYKHRVSNKMEYGTSDGDDCMTPSDMRNGD